MAIGHSGFAGQVPAMVNDTDKRTAATRRARPRAERRGAGTRRRVFEWALFVSCLALVVGANLPESTQARLGLDGQLLLWLLTSLVMFALLKYVRVALIAGIFVLALGANLSTELATALGINTASLTVTLAVLVVLWIANQFFDFLPSGLQGRRGEPAEQAVETLIRAIHDGDTRRLAALLKSGEVSANMRTPHSHTPLMLAVAVGYTDVVRLLLQNGADVAAQDNDGTTALGIAKRRGDEGIIDELVRHGAMS